MRWYPNAALNSHTNIVSADASWVEDIEITQNGVPYPNIDDHVWQIEIYRSPQSSTELVLSTSGVGLAIANSILSIRVTPSRLSGLCGDYLCDIVSTDQSPTIDGSPRVTLWSHGPITFTRGAR